ncbi:hypothetical protein GPECTOR_16g621 [Gonium pectorale]|uniref:Uncharacterized protein n=1 Tax=Gonium pectorale TaxID=33097 RepID=A0A150GKY3_GONPE|nr:hypothetical protein GPECTOR_16g621 [Gonium pectorale]|eukprot:KXZ50447.1 hypothetical protein GPECTOR_16g621 [Gonium pectorale]
MAAAASYPPPHHHYQQQPGAAPHQHPNLHVGAQTVRAPAPAMRIDTAAAAAGFGGAGFDALGHDRTPGGGGGTGAGGKRIPAWLREEMLKRAAAAAAGDAGKSAADQEDADDDGDGPAAQKRRDGGSGSRWGNVDTRADDGADEEAEEAERARKKEAARLREEVVNREIKTCLTKVLLEVTDALFEEVAREVYREATGPKRPTVKAEPADAPAPAAAGPNSGGSDARRRDGSSGSARPFQEAPRTAGVKREREQDEPAGRADGGRSGGSKSSANGGGKPAAAPQSGAVKLEAPLGVLGLVTEGEDDEEEGEGNGAAGGGGGGGAALLGLAYGSDDDE